MEVNVLKVFMYPRNGLWISIGYHVLPGMLGKWCSVLECEDWKKSKRIRIAQHLMSLQYIEARLTAVVLYTYRHSESNSMYYTHD